MVDFINTFFEGFTIPVALLFLCLYYIEKINKKVKKIEKHLEQRD